MMKRCNMFLGHIEEAVDADAAFGVELKRWEWCVLRGRLLSRTAAWPPGFMHYSHTHTLWWEAAGLRAWWSFTSARAVVECVLSMVLKQSTCPPFPAPTETPRKTTRPPPRPTRSCDWLLPPSGGTPPTPSPPKPVVCLFPRTTTRRRVTVSCAPETLQPANSSAHPLISTLLKLSCTETTCCCCCCTRTQAHTALSNSGRISLHRLSGRLWCSKSPPRIVSLESMFGPFLTSVYYARAEPPDGIEPWNMFRLPLRSLCFAFCSGLFGTEGIAFFGGFFWRCECELFMCVEPRLSQPLCCALKFYWFYLNIWE